MWPVSLRLKDYVILQVPMMTSWGTLTELWQSRVNNCIFSYPFIQLNINILCARWGIAFVPRRDKTNKMSVRPARTKISLGVRPGWSESSLYAHWVAKDPSFLHADSEDSDQTGLMPRLIWIFAGRTVTLLVLSWGGLFDVVQSFSWDPVI